MEQKKKSENTKKKIAYAAMTQFGTKGYEQTSLIDIADAIGMTKGAIYHHFSSKEDLLKYITAITQEQMLQSVATIVEDKTMSIDEKISKIIQYFMDSKQEKVLIQNSWVERVPYALLDTVRISNRKLAPYFEMLILESMSKEEGPCIFAKELAEVLVLLFDVWLDPVIFSLTESEMEKKLDFIYEMLNRFDVKLIDEENYQKMKTLYTGRRR